MKNILFLLDRRTDMCDYEVNSTPVTQQIEVHVYDKEAFYDMIMHFEYTSNHGCCNEETNTTEYWYDDFSVIIFWED